MVQIAQGKYSHHIHTKGERDIDFCQNHRVGEKDKIKVKWKDKQSGHGKDDYSRQLISTVILRVFLAAGKRTDCCCFETPKPV
jgi:hypothetical protein